MSVSVHADANSGSQAGTTAAKWALLGGTAGTAVGYGRLAAALPADVKNGKLGMWLWSAAPVIGPGPNNAVVPFKGGDIDIAGHVIHNVWGKAYAANNGLNIVAALLPAIAAVPNLYAAIHANGFKGIVDTKSGRTGLAEASSGAMALGITAAALAKDGKQMGALHALVSSELFGKLPVCIAGGTLATVVFANQDGVFDMLDAGNTQPSVTVLKHAAGNLKSTAQQMLVP